MIKTDAQSTTVTSVSITTTVKTTTKATTRPANLLLTPADGETVSVVTDIQREFMRQVREYGGVDNITMKIPSGENSHPNWVTLVWETVEKRSVVEVSETPDFADPMTIVTNNQQTLVENLKIDQTYYWRVNGCAPFTFYVADEGPRFIYVDWATNIRDLGCWKTADGKRIRQGMLYRGSKLEEELTDKGKEIIRDVLKIRTDLDLRQDSLETLTKSPLGEQVALVCIPTDGYSAFFGGNRKINCRKIFNLLADEKNYPIYFHCVGGVDRTGALAFVLELCLGVSEEDALLDYELTSLSAYGYRSRATSQYYETLAEYGDEDDTLNEKAYNFLLSCGIAEETIEKIRGILLEDDK